MVKVLWLETPDNPNFWVDPKWHIFSVMGNDVVNYQLWWATPPEPVVQMAMKNLTEVVVKDSSANHWTGQELLNMINRCKLENRLYDKIGTYF